MGQEKKTEQYKIILVILSCSISIYPNINRTTEFQKKCACTIFSRTNDAFLRLSVCRAYNFMIERVTFVFVYFCTSADLSNMINSQCPNEYHYKWYDLHKWWVNQLHYCHLQSLDFLRPNNLHQTFFYVHSE